MSEKLNESITDQELSSVSGGVLYGNTAPVANTYGTLDWNGYTYIYPYAVYADFGLGYVSGSAPLYSAPVNEQTFSYVTNQRVQLIENTVAGPDGVMYQKVFCLFDGRTGYVPYNSITMM